MLLYANRKRSMPATKIPGERGEQRSLLLELKLIADIGLVGFPNVTITTLASRRFYDICFLFTVISLLNRRASLLSWRLYRTPHRKLRLILLQRFIPISELFNFQMRLSIISLIFQVSLMAHTTIEVSAMTSCDISRGRKCCFL